MGHFHILKCDEKIFPVPGGKMIDWVRCHNFPPGDWKYHFFTLKDVEMPFPLEMSGFHPVFFLINPLKTH